VTAVVDATKVFGQVDIASSSFGNFTVQHYLGRTPKGVVIQMTLGGQIYFQTPTMYDGTNLYLVGSDSALTAKVIIW